MAGENPSDLHLFTLFSSSSLVMKPCLGVDRSVILECFSMSERLLDRLKNLIRVIFSFALERKLRHSILVFQTQSVQSREEASIATKTFTPTSSSLTHFGSDGTPSSSATTQPFKDS